MKVIPIKDRLLIKPVKDTESKTKSGIIIPESVSQGNQQAIVVSWGEDVPNEPLELGDKVLYKMTDGMEVNIDGQPHLLVRMPDILAVIE